MVQKLLKTLSVVFIVCVLFSCLPSFNKSGKVALEKAAILFEDDNFTEALAQIRIAESKRLTKDEQIDAFNIHGNIFSSLDEYDSALYYYNKALVLNPNYHVTLVNLGVTYRLLESYDEAEQAYQKALNIDPNYPELHASLGALYVFQEKYADAKVSIAKAIELDSTQPIAYANYAVALAYLGEYENAQIAFEKAQQLGYKNIANLRIILDDLKP